MKAAFAAIAAKTARPERRVGGLVRRIDRGEAGVAAFEHQPVQGSREPERQGIAAVRGLAGPAEHPVRQPDHRARDRPRGACRAAR